MCLWVALFIFYIIFHRRRRLRLFPLIIFVDGLEGWSVVWRGLHCFVFFTRLALFVVVCSPSPSSFFLSVHVMLFFSIIDIAQHIHPSCILNQHNAPIKPTSQLMQLNPHPPRNAYIFFARLYEYRNRNSQTMPYLCINYISNDDDDDLPLSISIHPSHWRNILLLLCKPETRQE